MISAWTKIEPDKNCYRYYAIWFEADLFDPFRVCCEWGRVGAKKHQRRVLIFQSWEEAHQYFKEMEELRLKRGYRTAIYENSSGEKSSHHIPIQHYS